MQKYSKLQLFFVLYISLVFVWWFKLHLVGNLDSNEPYYFNLFYGFLGLFGGAYGITAARRWGGFSSLVGKALMMLSFGLWCEWIANLIWGYYNIVQAIEIPYPSEADVFFFAIIFFYAIAMFYLARAANVALSLRKFQGRALSIAIPFVMLVIAYSLFVGEGLDTSDPVRLFFDLGYPLGEAITFSVALLTFLLTKDYLKGVMRMPVLAVLLAYLTQFIADYGFLFTALNETYYNGNWVDLFYAIGATSMSLAIIMFDKTLYNRRVVLEKGVIKSQEGSKSSFENQELYEYVIARIVRDQEKIVGPIALEQANNIEGLTITNKQSQVQITADPNTVLINLVKSYKELFGDASVEVIKDSVQSALSARPNLDPAFHITID